MTVPGVLCSVIGGRHGHTQVKKSNGKGRARQKGKWCKTALQEWAAAKHGHTSCCTHAKAQYAACAGPACTVAVCGGEQ